MCHKIPSKSVDVQFSDLDYQRWSLTVTNWLQAYTCIVYEKRCSLNFKSSQSSNGWASRKFTIHHCTAVLTKIKWPLWEDIHVWHRSVWFQSLFLTLFPHIVNFHSNAWKQLSNMLKEQRKSSVLPVWSGPWCSFSLCWPLEVMNLPVIESLNRQRTPLSW